MQKNNRKKKNSRGPPPKAKMWNNRSVLKQDKQLLNAVSRRQGKHAMSANCETICRNILDKNGKAINVVPPISLVVNNGVFTPVDSRVVKGVTEYGKRTFTVTCGTQGFGYLIFYPDQLCLHNVVYTTSAFTGSVTDLTAGGHQIGSAITGQASHRTKSLAYTTKAQITVCTNNTALLNRKGKIGSIVIPSAVSTNGWNTSTIADHQWGVINSVSLLESEQEVNMNWVNNMKWSEYFIGPPNTIGNFRFMMVCFQSAADDSFDVEVTQARFVQNSGAVIVDQIPRTIQSVVDAAAWNLVQACANNIEALNATFEEKAKAVKETYETMNHQAHDREPSSILKTLIPLAKEVFPSVIKYLL
jgi:hypothetical protein